MTKNYHTYTAFVELSHVHSICRQVYATIETYNNLPTTAVINYMGEQHRIFFNDDKVRCFHCKEYGHISSACPTVNAYDEKSEESESSLTLTNNDNMNSSRAIQAVVSQALYSPSQNNNTTNTCLENDIQTVMVDILLNTPQKKPPS